MARTFDGSAKRIELAIGNCAALGSGAYTIISLFRLEQFFGATGLISGRAGGGFNRYHIITGNKSFGWQDFSSGFGGFGGTNWWWTVQRKVAGNAVYEVAYAAYPVADPDVDIIFGQAPDAGLHGDPGACDALWIGQSDVLPRGGQALHTIFTRYLDNDEIKAALTQQLSDIMVLGPAGCWPLNQASSADDVVDVTDGGADQTAIVGDIPVEADPPGYDFSLSVTVTGSAHFDLGALGLAASGVRTTHGTATINFGALTLAASSITGGPSVADDFYSPGPCRPYEYVSMCTIPIEAAAVTGDALQAVYLADYPAGAFITASGVKNTALSFKTCIYKAIDVPRRTRRAAVNFAMPLSCFEWQNVYVYDFDQERFRTEWSGFPAAEAPLARPDRLPLILFAALLAALIAVVSSLRRLTGEKITAEEELVARNRNRRPWKRAR